MRLLLDEDIGWLNLQRALEAAGNNVVRSIDAIGGAAADSAVFAYAKAENRAIVSYNAVDFIALATADAEHHGMLLLYRDNLPSDLGLNDIVRAVGNIEKTYSGKVDAMVLNLNQFNW